MRFLRTITFSFYERAPFQSGNMRIASPCLERDLLPAHNLAGECLISLAQRSTCACPCHFPSGPRFVFPDFIVKSAPRFPAIIAARNSNTIPSGRRCLGLRIWAFIVRSKGGGYASQYLQPEGLRCPFCCPCKPKEFKIKTVFFVRGNPQDGLMLLPCDPSAVAISDFWPRLF